MGNTSQAVGVVDSASTSLPAWRRWASVLVVCLGVMMTFINMSATLSALAFIQRDLHVSSVTLVWVPSAFTLATVSLIMSAGTFGELYGRRRTYVIGAMLVVLGSVIAFVAGNVGGLIAAQAVMGIGAAAALPSSLSIVANTFIDQHDRTRAISVWASTAGVGLAIGPLVAGAVLDTFSWHSVYLTNVALGAAALALVPFFVAESRHPARRLDLFGVLLGTATLGALALAVIEGGARGYATPLNVAAYFVVVAGLVLLVMVELRHGDPMLDLRLFRSSSFAVIQVVAAAVMFGFVGSCLLTVLYLERVARLDALSTGIRLLPMMLSYIVVSALAARVVRSVGFKVTLTAGLAVMGLGALALQRIGVGSGYGAMWPPLLALGIGAALLVAPSTAAAVNSVPPLQAGMASATVNMFRQLGSMLGASVLGTIATSQFPKNLAVDLAEQGVDPAAAGRIVAAATRGARPTTENPLDPLVDRAISSAFTSALHLAYLVAGIALLVMATLAVNFIRPRTPISPDPLSNSTN